MILDQLRLALRPGSGLAARFANVILYLPDHGPEQADLAVRMVQLARDASPAAQPGRTLARSLAGLLLGPDADRVPPFACLGAIGDDVAVMVYGDVVVESTGAVSSVRISGAEAATWVDRIIGGGFTSMSITGAGREATDAASVFELTRGVAPVASVLLAGDAAAAPQAVEPAATEEPAPPAETPPPEPPAPEPAAPVADPASEPEPEPGVVSLAGASDEEALLSSQSLSDSVLFSDLEEVERREPLPVLAPPEPQPDTPVTAPLPVATPAERPAATVTGVLCKHGHFNHPRALYCAYDGSAMVDVTRIEVQGPRPSLGVLIFDDGSAYSLEAPYVVGRRPHDHAALLSGEALPLAVTDTEEQISRNHLFVNLDGWDVTITDLGSRNGTFVSAPSHPEAVRLMPQEPQPLEPGMRVRLGGRSFVYESHHRR